MPTKLIGTGANQVPTNGDLGTLAFQNRDAVSVEKLSVGGAISASTQLYVAGDAELTQALNGSAQILRLKNNHVGNSSPARLIIQTRGWTDSDAIINLDAAATNARWSLGADAAGGKFVIANADLNNFTGSNEVFQIAGATGNATFSGDIQMSAGKMLNFADDMGPQWADNKITGSNVHDTLYFLTGSGERMRINASGLSIGHSTTAERKLDVAGDTHIRSTGANTSGRFWQYVRAVGDNPSNVDIVEATFPDYCTAVIKVRVTGRGTSALNTQHYSEQTYAVSTDNSSVNAQAGTQIDIDQAFTLTLGTSNQQVTVDVTGSSVGNVTAYIEILSSAVVANNI